MTKLLGDPRPERHTPPTPYSTLLCPVLAPLKSGSVSLPHCSWGISTLGPVTSPIRLCLKPIVADCSREKFPYLEIPWWSSGVDPLHPLQQAWVWSLVREIRSHMPCDTAKTKDLKKRNSLMHTSTFLPSTLATCYKKLTHWERS